MYVDMKISFLILIAILPHRHSSYVHNLVDQSVGNKKWRKRYEGVVVKGLCKLIKSSGEIFSLQIFGNTLYPSRFCLCNIAAYSEVFTNKNQLFLITQAAS